jgi:hypothetical protein
MWVAVISWVAVAAVPLDVVSDGVRVKGHLLMLVVNFKGAGFHVFLLPPEVVFLPVEDFKEDSPVAQPNPLPMFPLMVFRVAILRANKACPHIVPWNTLLARQRYNSSHIQMW